MSSETRAKPFLPPPRPPAKLLLRTPSPSPHPVPLHAHPDRAAVEPRGGARRPARAAQPRSPHHVPAAPGLRAQAAVPGPQDAHRLLPLLARDGPARSRPCDRDVVRLDPLEHLAPVLRRTGGVSSQRACFFFLISLGLFPFFV